MAALASTFHPGRAAARTSSTPQLLRRSCKNYASVWSGADRPARARCLQKGRRRPVDAGWDRRAVLFADLQGELLSDRRRHFVFGQQGRHRRVDATIRRDAFHARDSPVEQRLQSAAARSAATRSADFWARLQSAELSQQSSVSRTPVSRTQPAHTPSTSLSTYDAMVRPARPPPPHTHSPKQARACARERSRARPFPLSLLLRPCGVRARA